MPAKKPTRVSVPAAWVDVVRFYWRGLHTWQVSYRASPNGTWLLAEAVAIPELVEEAEATNRADQRSERRFPYFRAVSVIVGESGERNYSAFSKDISQGGMGLLHSMPLESGKATLRVCDDEGGALVLPCEIKWCKPAGEGWYLSGAAFIETA